MPKPRVWLSPVGACVVAAALMIVDHAFGREATLRTGAAIAITAVAAAWLTQQARAVRRRRSPPRVPGVRRAHPLFIATLIGIPATGVAIVGYAKWSALRVVATPSVSEPPPRDGVSLDELVRRTAPLGARVREQVLAVDAAESSGGDGRAEIRALEPVEREAADLAQWSDEVDFQLRQVIPGWGTPAARDRLIADGRISLRAALARPAAYVSELRTLRFRLRVLHEPELAASAQGGGH